MTELIKVEDALLFALPIAAGSTKVTEDTRDPNIAQIVYQTRNGKRIEFEVNKKQWMSIGSETLDRKLGEFAARVVLRLMEEGATLEFK